MQANAAHARYSPGPADTSMPRGSWTDWTLTVHVLIVSALLMMTVQRAEPARTNMLAIMAQEVDRKKAQACLTTPLYKKAT